MKQYKYFFKVYDENGHLFFSHRSNFASQLLKLAKKSSYDDSGEILFRWYCGRTEHNIPVEIQYRVYCGEKI